MENESFYQSEVACGVSEDALPFASAEAAGRFHYRVTGVVVNGGRVLLSQAEIDDFWTLPGGHVHLHETAEDALRREMREELGTDVMVHRLLWALESFFFSDQIRHHEVGFYFLMDFAPGSGLYSQDRFSGDEGGLHLSLRWFPRERDLLASLPVLPVFLQEALAAELPTGPLHIVNREIHPQDGGVLPAGPSQVGSFPYSARRWRCCGSFALFRQE